MDCPVVLRPGLYEDYHCPDDVRLARVVETIPTDITPETQQQMKNRGPLEMGIQSVLNFLYPVVAMLKVRPLGPDASWPFVVTCA